MPNPRSLSRWEVICRAWPWQGAVFVFLSFVVTMTQLGYGILGPSSEQRFGWLDPLGAVLGGIGAFILAAVLIFRRVDSARAEAEDYRLARGLATGYYFNFVRPLIKAIRDPQHDLHAKAKASGASRIAGLVVGIPQTMADFDPARHAALLKVLSEVLGKSFKFEDIKVDIAGRPRPVFAKLATSSESKVALIVDIPTTLSVIADFAEFVAQRGGEAAASGDEFVTQARKEIVSASETSQFGEHLKERLVDEFRDVANKIGAMEPRETSPISLLDIVSLPRLRRRMDELADH